MMMLMDDNNNFLNNKPYSRVLVDVDGFVSFASWICYLKEDGYLSISIACFHDGDGVMKRDQLSFPFPILSSSFLFAVHVEKLEHNPRSEQHVRNDITIKNSKRIVYIFKKIGWHGRKL